MNIDRELVLHVARLANLELSENEVGHYQEQLARVLDYVKILEKVVKPTAIENEAESDNSPERSDQVLPSLTNDEALANSPSKRDGMFQVPKIID